MTKRGASLATLILVVVALAVMSCKNDTEGTTPTKSQLAAPTNPKAYSADTTSVGLLWSASTDAGLADMASYQITVKQGSATIKTETASKTDSSKVVTGLTPGIYTFEILALATSSSSSYSNSNSVSMTWAPANRYVYDERVIGRDIKVYETSSSIGGSALVVSKPKVVSVARPGSADSLLIDLYARTVTNGIALRSIRLYQSGSGANPYNRISRVIPTPRDLISLDTPPGTLPDSTLYVEADVTIDAATTAASSKVYYFKGNNGNYGRILVKRATTGSLVWGTSPDRYLNLEISYQTQPYNPFAKPITIGSRQERSAR